MKKSKVALFLFGILFLSVSFSTLSAQKPQRPQPAFKYFNHDGTGQQDVNAYLLCYLSCMVYTQDLLGTPNETTSNAVWELNHDQNEFERLFITKMTPHFPKDATMKWFHETDPSATIIDGTYDPEAMAISTKDFIIIVFRGTDRVEQTTQSEYAYGEWIGTNFDPVPIRTSDLGRGKVHRGFYNSFSLIKSDLADWVIDNGASEKKVWITGHSLGGVHAQMLAAYLANRHKINAQGVFLFASPHVGDTDFVNDFNTKIGKSRIQRFEFSNDPATQVPGLMYYARAGTRNYFDNLHSYEHGVEERLAPISSYDITGGGCWHYTGWYLNACYNLLSTSQKTHLPQPFEVPNDSYDMCFNLHEWRGEGNHFERVEEVAVWTIERGRLYMEQALEAGHTLSQIARHLYEVGELTIPEIITIFQEGSKAGVDIAIAIIALNEGDVVTSIRFLFRAGVSGVKVAQALIELGKDSDEILGHLSEAGLGLMELADIAREVWGMSWENFLSIMNSEPVEDLKNVALGAWNIVFNPDYPVGLGPEISYRIKHVVTRDVRVKDKVYLGFTAAPQNASIPQLFSADNRYLNNFETTWEIEKISGLADRYFIVPSSTKVLETGARDETLQTWSKTKPTTTSTHQHWEIIKQPDGHYEIRNVGNGKYLYVTNDGSVVTNNPGNYEKHYWEFEEVQ